MKAPRFWWERPPTLAAQLLAGLGWVYGAITLRRMARPGAKAAVPVVCIGNFVAGGAGKTPTAIAVAVALRECGHRPVFLTRGYGGSHQGAPLVVDPAVHDAGLTGDEALLLARIAPTVVCANRVSGAEAAVAIGASVIVMDDGLQNPALGKTFSLAVIDGTRGHGNGLCLPAGPLRAPAEAQAQHVQALLAIGLGQGTSEAAALGQAAGRPVFRTDLIVDEVQAEQLAGEKVLAFAGIGNPDKFYETLRGLYVKIVAAQPFPDHHAYTDAQAQALMDQARRQGLKLVTTEKDAVRLKGSRILEALKAEAVALPVRLRLPGDLADLIVTAVGRPRAPV